MANKFQKSVQERLEEEAKRQSEKKRADQKVVPEAIEPEVMVPSQVVEESAPDTESGIDLSRFLRPEQQRIAKNKTFYLDADIIEAVKSTAKARRITDSKLVNDILRGVLGL